MLRLFAIIGPLLAAAIEPPEEAVAHRRRTYIEGTCRRGCAPLMIQLDGGLGCPICGLTEFRGRRRIKVYPATVAMYDRRVKWANS